MSPRILLVTVTVVFAVLVSSAQAYEPEQSAQAYKPTQHSSPVSKTVRSVSLSSLTTGERQQMQSHPLKDPQIVQISGEHVGNGCSYKVKLYLAPHERATQFDELSSDAATCSMIGQRGVPARLEPQDRLSRRGHQATTRQLSPDQVCCGGGGGWPEAAGYHHAWYEDPLTIDVTSVKNFLDYVYGNGAVQAILSCRIESGWYTPTDWRLTSGPSAVCAIDSNGNPYVWSRVFFANLYFCDPTAWTYNSYDRNWITGSKLGGLGGVANAYKSGDCNSLLYYHSNLVRTI
jgi:hypothetical protein